MYMTKKQSNSMRMASLGADIYREIFNLKEPRSENL